MSFMVSIANYAESLRGFTAIVVSDYDKYLEQYFWRDVIGANLLLVTLVYCVIFCAELEILDGGIDNQ